MKDKKWLREDGVASCETAADGRALKWHTFSLSVLSSPLQTPTSIPGNGMIMKNKCARLIRL